MAAGWNKDREGNDVWTPGAQFPTMFRFTTISERLAIARQMERLFNVVEDEDGNPLWLRTYDGRRFEESSLS